MPAIRQARAIRQGILRFVGPSVTRLSAVDAIPEELKCADAAAATLDPAIAVLQSKFLGRSTNT